MNCCDLLCEANSKRSDQLKSNDFLKFVFGGISDLYTRTIRFQIGKKIIWIKKPEGKVRKKNLMTFVGVA